VAALTRLNLRGSILCAFAREFVVHLLCRLGRHLPSGRSQLDLTDEQVKSYCKLCGAVLIHSQGSVVIESPVTELPATDGVSRILGLVALALFPLVVLAVSASAWTHASHEKRRSSITVILPAAKPVEAAAAGAPDTKHFLQR